MNEELERAMNSDRKRLETMTLDDLDWEYFKRFKTRARDRGRVYLVERLLAVRWSDALARDANNAALPATPASSS